MAAAPQLVAQVRSLERSAGRRRARSSQATSRRHQAATRRRWTRRRRRDCRPLSTPGEADAFVAARVADGSEFIKIIYDDTRDAYPGRPLPTLDENTVAALVTAAHARGRLAVAHIGNERYARSAIAAGVDGLAHLFVGTDCVGRLRAICGKRGVVRHPDVVGAVFGVRETGWSGLPQRRRHHEIREAAIPRSASRCRQQPRRCRATRRHRRSVSWPRPKCRCWREPTLPHRD